MNSISLSQCLQASMSAVPETRKSAEKYMADCEKNVGYLSLLLEVIGMGDLEIKVAAAISFKNFVKKNWAFNESNDDRIDRSVRDAVKNNILELMLQSPPSVQRQLSEAVAIIGSNDFPEQWPNLLPQIVTKISEGNFTVINGVLRTCHSLFKRYRFENRSDSLWLSIKEVITKMAPPITGLMQQTMALIEQHQNDQNALSVLWSSVLLITKIFHSLNSQDLPEYFEDNMTAWMTQFHAVLQASGSQGDSDEAGLQEQVKTEVCGILSLYAAKYDDEFSEGFLKVFVADVYSLLLATTSAHRYDSLVTEALHFLGIVADKPRHRAVFNDVVNVQQLCRQVVLPNIELQQSDLELFEDSPEEYIRKDIEGSNALTRRKSACELVKSLNRFQENEIVASFGQYIDMLLSGYRSDPASNWKYKDSALFLVTSVASRGETERLGVTSATPFVDVRSFYSSEVAPELTSPQRGHPIVQAACLKYLVAFRSLLAAEEVRLALGMLAPFLGSPAAVVRGYAAVAVSKLLMVRDPTSPSQAVIRGDQISQPTALLRSLCAAVSLSPGQDDVYAAQALMRVLSALQTLATASLNHLVPFLDGHLQQVVSTPRKPLFNHCLVEAVALCVRIGCGRPGERPDTLAYFESLLFPSLQTVLVNGVDEMLPYAFQMYSLLLDLHGSGGALPPVFVQLLPFLTAAEAAPLWERPGNVPALTRLLVSYLEKGAFADRLADLVQIFSRLNGSRALDSFGFSLATALVMNVSREAVEPHLQAMMRAVFGRLSRNKTAKYLRGLLPFLAAVCTRYEVGWLVALVDQMQAGLFKMTVESAILPTIATVSGALDKKVVAVGMVRLAEGLLPLDHYRGYWPLIVSRVVEALSSYCHDDSGRLDDNSTEAHFTEVDDGTRGGSTAFNQLLFVPRKATDPCQEAGDPRAFLGASLGRVAASQPQLFGQMVAQMDAPVLEALKAQMAAVGVSL